MSGALPFTPWLVCDADIVTGHVVRRGTGKGESDGESADANSADANHAGADRSRENYEAIWLLTRRNSEPLGVSKHYLTQRGPITDEDVLSIARESLGTSVDAAGGADDATPPRSLASPDAVPPISVLLCTRRRPDALRRCLLSLTRQTHPSYEIVVIDNDPSADSARAVTAEVAAASHVSITYARQTTPGLSHARNAGVELARFEHVACIDDDEEADPDWLMEVATTFILNPSCDVVTGPMFPAELRSPAQVLYEKFGGHSKGREATRGILSAATVEPCFPLPAFGAGGNMAFTVSALRRVGMFDVALGAGTKPAGGEDTQFFTKHMLSGGSIAYEPRTLVWHYHRSSMQELTFQLNSYGRSLTAYYASLLLTRPQVIPHLIALAPRALREIFSSNGVRVTATAEDFPAELLANNRRAMLGGPWAYVTERIHQRKVAIIGSRSQPSQGQPDHHQLGHGPLGPSRSATR